MRSGVFKIIAVNVLIFLGLLLSLEVMLQLIAVIYPSYDVLFLQPDKVLGWKQVPNLHWTWAGHHWYAADFSVDVETNPLGFRDIAREFPKPHGVKRIALLGDSFIEAVQVSFEKTSGQLLERSLNCSSDQGQKNSQRYEVLNFGISNYGIGQYLLTWEEYARKYEPDYIIIFVAKLHMNRTVEKYEQAVFAKDKKLWVRPTFRLENDQIVSEPARDFDEFIEVQKSLIAKEFYGLRSRRKRQWILPYYAGQLWPHVPRWIRRRLGQGSKSDPSHRGRR